MKKGIILAFLGCFITLSYAYEDYFYNFSNDTKNAIFNIITYSSGNNCYIQGIEGPFTLNPQTKKQILLSNQNISNDDCKFRISTWSPNISEGDDIWLVLTLMPHNYETQGYSCSKNPRGNLYLCKDNSQNFIHPKYTTIYEPTVKFYYDSQNH